MFSFGGTVQTLDPKQVTNLDKAAANARAFANEVVAMLKASQANPVSEVA
jgi:chromosome partitioning protein